MNPRDREFFLRGAGMTAPGGRSSVLSLDQQLLNRPLNLKCHQIGFSFRLLFRSSLFFIPLYGFLPFLWHLDITFPGIPAREGVTIKQIFRVYPELQDWNPPPFFFGCNLLSLWIEFEYFFFSYLSLINPSLVGL